MSLSKRQKQRIGLIIAFLITSYFASQYQPPAPANSKQQSIPLEQLIAQQQSGVQIAITSQVVRLLDDNLTGDRQQRFLIQLASGQTVLIAHNIDIAPRIADLKQGDIVSIYGEYNWNKQGGVIHWTHHDPTQDHIDGWIEHNGQHYQ